MGKTGVGGPRHVVLHVTRAAVRVPGPARSAADRSVFLAHARSLLRRLLVLCRIPEYVPGRRTDFGRFFQRENAIWRVP